MHLVKKTAVLAGIFFITACSKKDAAPVQNPDIEKNLQSAAWQMTVFTIAPALNGVTDVLLNTPPCAKDNLLRFNANGIFLMDEGASKCDPSDPQTDQGVWNYDGSIKQLSYASPKLGSFVIDVKDASAGSISGTRSVLISGIAYTFSGTLTKQ